MSKNFTHIMVTCNLCEQPAHGHFGIVIGGKNMLVCKDCHEFLEKKKANLPTKNYFCDVVISCNAVSLEDAAQKFQKHLEKYFGASINMKVISYSVDLKEND